MDVTVLTASSVRQTVTEEEEEDIRPEAEGGASSQRRSKNEEEETLKLQITKAAKCVYDTRCVLMSVGLFQ